MCGADCIDPSSDSNHCGGCFSPCSSGCHQGECVVWEQVESGFSFFCALDTKKRLWCAGTNTEGQVGDGTMQFSKSPKLVLEDVEQFALGSFSACALVSGGSVFCWGRGEEGAVGNGSEENQSTPQKVDLPTIRQLALTDRTACAVTEEDELLCWGDNGGFKLNDGTQEKSGIPKKINIPPVDRIYVGDAHLCAFTKADSILCWGQNHFGEFANGQMDTDMGIHELVPSEPLQYLAMGYAYTCGLTVSKTVICSGWNAKGQLGNGSSEKSQAYFTPILNEKPVKALIAANETLYALLEDGQVIAWGDNIFGQLGVGKTEEELPLSATPLLLPISNIKTVGRSVHNPCAITSENQVLCWGQKITEKMYLEYVISPTIASWAQFPASGD
jgi:alpha-tubulin suppressor-like RCC1 family protein